MDLKNELGLEALKVAAENLGQKEATGNNDGPFVRMLQHWAAKGSEALDGAPWCCCFATWCCYQAAERMGLRPVVPVMPKCASSTSLYAWFVEHNLILAKPIPGAVGLVKGSGGTVGKNHHHTFLVESVDGDWVNGIDGNFKNAVGRSKRLASDCDFGLPL